jgi:predicted nucleotidyltransferase component of viral defense system
MLYLQAIEPGTLELLKKIMNEKMFNDFFLVGGTGLSLQIGHRISEDLDLFTQHDFSIDQIKPVLEGLGKMKLTGESRNTMNCYLEGIKVDMITYKYPFVQDLIQDKGIRIASIPDIAAMKLSAIAQRGAKKDFFDLYFLLKTYNFDQLFTFFRLKFPSIDIFHILRSLIYFDDAENEADPKKIINISWKTVKAEITKSVKQFSG